MTLKQLEAFYWMVKLGSFAAAADKLCVSQSTLSKRISELESMVDQALVDKTARRLVLTQAGQEVFATASRMLELASSLRHRLGAGDEARGEVRIGIGELAASTWFPPLAERLLSGSPNFLLVPTVAQGRAMLESVAKGTLDCAVSAWVPEDPDLTSVGICSTRFAWVAAPALSMQIEEWTPASVSRFPFIRPSLQSGQSRIFEDWVGDAGPIEPKVSCNSLYATIELTSAGIGVSLLPRMFLQPLVHRGLLVYLESNPPPPSLDYYFVWHRSDRRPAIELARKLVREAIDHDIPSVLFH